MMMKRLLFALLTTALCAAAAGQITMDTGASQNDNAIVLGKTYSAPAVASTGELVIPVVTDAYFLEIVNNIKEDTSPMEALLSFIVCLSETTTAAQTNAVNFYNNLTQAERNNQLSDISSAEDLKNTVAPTYWAIYQQFSDNQKKLFFTATIETASNWTPPKQAILSGVGTPTESTTTVKAQAVTNAGPGIVTATEQARAAEVEKESQDLKAAAGTAAAAKAAAAVPATPAAIKAATDAAQAAADALRKQKQATIETAVTPGASTGSTPKTVVK
jgi:hypothetical protein